MAHYTIPGTYTFALVPGKPVVFRLWAAGGNGGGGIIAQATGGGGGGGGGFALGDVTHFFGATSLTVVVPAGGSGTAASILFTNGSKAGMGLVVGSGGNAGAPQAGNGGDLISDDFDWIRSDPGQFGEDGVDGDLIGGDGGRAGGEGGFGGVGTEDPGVPGGDGMSPGGGGGGGLNFPTVITPGGNGARGEAFVNFTHRPSSSWLPLGLSL